MNLWAVFIVVLLFKVICLESTLIVDAPAGQIEGIVTSVQHGGEKYDVTSYLGIPFAESPIQELRFAKPVKKKHFDKLFKAIERGPACIQLEYEPKAQTSEDCLNLNVIVPRRHGNNANVEKKAVMIYIHGGWWQYGLQDEYISPAFVAKNDVILVTLNYRLNAYGFLANENFGLKGNYGLWDQHMGIKWVHDNIDAFGGDTARITLVGNSAGSASVLLQALFPGNKGLFKGVVALSGSLVAPWAHNREYKTTFQDFTRRCGCSSDVDTVGCLRKLNASALDVDMTFLTAKLHLPVFDGEFVTFSPKYFDVSSKSSSDVIDRLSNVDLIVGLTSSDGSWNYKEWTSEVKERGSEFAVGITESDFRYLISLVDELLALGFSELDKSAIIHQYIDWSDPNNLAAIRDAFLDMVKDQEFTNGAVRVALAHARGKGRGQTYIYEFDHKPSFSKAPAYIKGAVHEDELPYVFSFPNDLMEKRDVADEDPVLKLTKAEVALSDEFGNLLATFAKARGPEDLSSFPWPTFNSSDQKYLKLRADGFSTGSHYRASAVHFWNVLMPQIKAAEQVDVSGGTRLRPLRLLTNALVCWAVVHYAIMTCFY